MHDIAFFYTISNMLIPLAHGGAAGNTTSL